MTETIIHSIRVTYDQSDERVRKFVNYLKNDARKNEMTAYYGSAKAAAPAEKYILAFGDEFSFACDDSHKCILKLRGT